MSENARKSTAQIDAAFVEELANFIREERRRLREEFASRPDIRGRAFCVRLTEVTDNILRRMFYAACTECGLSEDGVSPSGARMAVLATGGYGRRELAPFSDVDVTFAVSEEGDPNIDAAARKLFMLIMEVFTEKANLKVGYAYRLMEECADLDQQTQTALLDARWVAGNAELAKSFSEALAASLEPGVFVYHKKEEREKAWEKLGGTVYVTEPNVKEGVGGLRDFHAAMWAARVRYSIKEHDPIPALRKSGLLTPDDELQLSSALNFLLSVRQALHYRSGRMSDVLAMDKQDSVAEDLGFAPPVDVLAGDSQPPARLLMEQYYTHAANLHRICRRILTVSAEGPLALRGGLVWRDGCIHAGLADAPPKPHEAVTELVRHVQAYGMEPAPELVFSLRRQCQADGKENGSSALDRMFPQLLSTVLSALQGVTRGVRLLLDLGLMAKYLPEFDVLMRTTPLSLAHRYTIGEHTLRVLELLEQMRSHQDESGAEYKRIFESLSRPEVLFLAALLHDAGKVDLSRSHAETGAQIARRVAERMGLDSGVAEQVEFLVRHHLLMSETIRLRDLHQEQTIRDFVAVVNTPELLNMLYLLTRADMEATGPGVWTPVQSQFLDDLYYRAEAAIAGYMPPQDVEAIADGYRNRVREELSLHNLPPADVERHCKLMPVTYLLNTPPTEIAAHIRMVQRALATGAPVVRFSNESGRGFTVMTICVREDPQPGLLSKIAGVLYANDVAVHAAQVFTSSRGQLESGEEVPSLAIDTLWVDSRGKELSRTKRIEVERDLVRVLSGQMSVSELLGRKGRRLGEGSEIINITARNDLSDTHTVIEIRTPDQRGLLYRITRAIAAQGWHIHSARVNTVGAEARDAFYVTDSGGRKVTVDTAALAEAIKHPI